MTYRLLIKRFATDIPFEVQGATERTLSAKLARLERIAERLRAEFPEVAIDCRACAA